MSMDEMTRYDDVLMTVAGQCGGIEPLLNVFFSFLYRKTDFFHVMQKGETKMGFPEGVAEKIVVQKDELSYNGGATERFSWEQTLNDVTIQIPMPVGTKARDIVCTITKTHLTVKLKGQPPIVDADYPCDARNGQEIWEKVRTDECYWNLQPGSGAKPPHVSVYLEKERESWWKSAVDGAAEIDTTQVDSTRQVYDYDDETQGAIRKIMFDQDQKRKGLPTSDEIKNEDMLRNAWNAEGSPFKGTPFDPSMVNFGGGGGGGGNMPLPEAPPMG